MTTEEHVVTAETHLRYVEGHLQPSEEHLADAEVHLKLVKAHLATLDMAELAEAGPLETATPLSPKPSGSEAEAGQDRGAPVERERNPTVRSRVRPAQRGRKPAGKTEGTPPPWSGGGVGVPCQRVPGSSGPPPGRVRRVQGPVSHPEAKGAQGMGSLRMLLTDCQDRRVRGVTTGSGSGGITC
jgi:hypothetical protein